ncbi:hypothetical protein Hanom_Chr00s000001g01592981 [Helianthus anomalus]
MMMLIDDESPTKRMSEDGGDGALAGDVDLWRRQATSVAAQVVVVIISSTILGSDGSGINRVSSSRNLDVSCVFVRV